MTPPPLPQPSNALTYIVLTLVTIGAVGFLYLLFGELFLVALAPFGILGLLGGLHYLLWGRAMSEASSNDTDPPPG